ncbi:MAG: hypothetical protein JSW47_16725, partial [Phycisphaerales bacterium]
MIPLVALWQGSSLVDSALFGGSGHPSNPSVMTNVKQFPTSLGEAITLQNDPWQAINQGVLDKSCGGGIFACDYALGNDDDFGS